MIKLAYASQFLTFGIVGVAATLTHIGVAWITFEAGLAPIIANLAGVAVAFLVSFFGNANFTFTSQRSLLQTCRRYFLLPTLSYIISTVILQLVQFFDLPTIIFAIAVLILVPPLTFLLAKFWVFGLPEDGRDNSAGSATWN